MPDIKYVVVSDLHLGAENSILTNLFEGSYETDTSKASPVMKKVVECIGELIKKNENDEKPTLILNGDLMELALNSTNNAAMAFERLIELITPANGEEPLFNNEIYFIAGNHDHNLWERSRNYKYVQYLKGLDTKDKIEDEIHCTSMFNPEQIDENFLNAIVQRHPELKQVRVNAIYPAMAKLSDDKQKCVVFCHGHYIESMYALMTSLRSRVFPDRNQPDSLAELEKENYAWVDFFWSTLGRSGSVGKDIDLIYDKLQDSDEVKKMIHNIADSFTKNNKHRFLRWAETEFLEELLKLTIGRLANNERSEPDDVLTADANTGLRVLLEKYILKQLKDELGFVPPDVSFIFGHTHKPFQKAFDFSGFSNPVKVYNSGGWVVDTMKTQALHGASVILVDEHADIVVLQMYREGKYNVTLEEIKDANEQSCDFFKRIQSLVNMDRDPWNGFANVVMQEVELRHKYLSVIAKSQD